MASAQPVDDSFLDEVDDSFLDEPTTTRSDAAPAHNAAPKDFRESAALALKQWQERQGKTLGMDNEALLAGMVRIPSLGFRQDLGQFGAAALDKAMGSEIPFGDLVKRAKPQVEKYYGDLEAEHPIASAVGAGVGGIPMAAAVNPATAGVARIAPNVAPWLAKALGIGAAGLDNAAMAGLLRFNETGDTDKALDDAKIAGAMGSAFAAAPVLYHGAKGAIGKGLQKPREGLDGLAKMLGKSDMPAAPVSGAADGAIPMPPEAPPMSPPAQAPPQQAAAGMNVGKMSKADADRMWAEARAKAAKPSPNEDTGAMKYVDSQIDAAGKGGLPPNKDPEFLRKSQELADMLAQSDAPPVTSDEGFNVGKIKRGEMEEIQHEARDRARRMAQEAKNAARASAENADTVVAPVDIKPHTIHEQSTPNQIQDGAKYAASRGLDPDVPFSDQGGPHIKHKGAYRNKGYSFPKDKAGWENEPAAWKIGADDSEPSGGIMEMMMRESEGPQTSAGIEALNRNERNMSRMRNPSDVDSRVFRQPQEQPAMANADKATNAKGSGGSVYDPMGVGSVENVRPSDADLFADVQRKAAAAGKPDFSTAREATAGEEALWGEALNRMRAKGLLDNVETTGGQGTKVFTKVAEPFPDPITMTKPAAAPFPDPVTSSRFMPPPAAAMPPPGAPPMQPGPTLEAEAARIASGKERIRKLLGIAGGISGGYAGGQAGGIIGAIGGAGVGKAAAVGSFNKFDKAADKMHTLGQKMLTDPAKLQQLEMQGGQMGKAASFIMEGARDGGEAAMAARAFIVASQPWYRSQFANQDEK